MQFTEKFYGYKSIRNISKGILPEPEDNPARLGSYTEGRKGVIFKSECKKYLKNFKEWCETQQINSSVIGVIDVFDRKFIQYSGALPHGEGLTQFKISENARRLPLYQEGFAALCTLIDSLEDDTLNLDFKKNWVLNLLAGLDECSPGVYTNIMNTFQLLMAQKNRGCYFMNLRKQLLETNILTLLNRKKIGKQFEIHYVNKIINKLASLDKVRVELIDDLYENTCKQKTFEPILHHIQKNIDSILSVDNVIHFIVRDFDPKQVCLDLNKKLRCFTDIINTYEEKLNFYGSEGEKRVFDIHKLFDTEDYQSYQASWQARYILICSLIMRFEAEGYIPAKRRRYVWNEHLIHHDLGESLMFSYVEDTAQNDDMRYQPFLPFLVEQVIQNNFDSWLNFIGNDEQYGKEFFEAMSLYLNRKDGGFEKIDRNVFKKILWGFKGDSLLSIPDAQLAVFLELLQGEDIFIYLQRVHSEKNLRYSELFNKIFKNVSSVEKKQGLCDLLCSLNHVENTIITAYNFAIEIGEVDLLKAVSKHYIPKQRILLRDLRLSIQNNQIGMLEELFLLLVQKQKETSLIQLKYKNRNKKTTSLWTAHLEKKRGELGLRNSSLPEEQLERKVLIEKIKKTKDYDSLMPYAGSFGSIQAIKILVEKFLLDVNEVNVSKRETALMLAVRRGNEEIIKYLLEQNADAQLVNSYGKKAYHIALKKGHLSVARSLITKERIVRENDYTLKETLLSLAVKKNNIDIVKQLIGLGSKPNRMLINGVDSLFTYAARYGYSSILKLFVEKKFDVSYPGTYGVSPLDLAVMYDEHESVEVLLKSPEIREGIHVVREQKTVLQRAVLQGNHHIVSMILDAGARPCKKVDGKTAMDYAIEQESNAIVTLLLAVESFDKIDYKAFENIIELSIKTYEIDLLIALKKKFPKISPCPEKLEGWLAECEKEGAYCYEILLLPYLFKSVPQDKEVCVQKIKEVSAQTFSLQRECLAIYRFEALYDDLKVIAKGSEGKKGQFLSTFRQMLDTAYSLIGEDSNMDIFYEEIASLSDEMKKYSRTSCRRFFKNIFSSEKSVSSIGGDIQYLAYYQGRHSEAQPRDLQL